MFEKGWKGGPGRPKGSSHVDLCKTWSEKKGGAWDILFQWAQGTEVKGARRSRVPKELRKFAIERILSYGYGKPKESIDLGNPDGSLAGILRGFIAGGSESGSADGIRPPGKILHTHPGNQPVGQTDRDRPLDKKS